MQILNFDCLESTHLYLAQNLRSFVLKPPVMVVAKEQSGGIGSRGNAWESVLEGLYFSFALSLESLPDDLPLESTSIYMGFIFKEILNAQGAHVWLKWPNDLYVKDKKIGGILCTRIQNNILVGIGTNLKTNNENFGVLDIEISKEAVLQEFIGILKNAKKNLSWKQIFSKYALEFSLNFSFCFHYKGEIVTLRNAILCEDGAILLNGEKIYSLR